jgi:predicted RND superfamily exporter protein
MALAMGGKNLAFTNDYHMFFSDDNPQLIAFDNLQDTYNKTDNIIIGLRDTTNGIFTEQNLRIIADITDKAWQTPFSTRVDSLSNYQHTYANADDLIVFDLVDIELTTLDSKHIESIATSELLLKNRLITNAKDTTGINITINLPDNEQEATIGQAQAVKFARELRDTIKKEYPQFEVFLSGVIMLNNAFPEAGQGDMQTLVPLSFLVVFILLLIILRSPILVLGALLLMVFTIVGAMGSAGHLLLPITPPMTSMPVIMLTIAVAGSVHLMMSFKKHMQLGEDKITALINAFNHNVKAITIAAITTAIGFFRIKFFGSPTIS